MDSGTLKYIASFSLMDRAMHIKYRDGGWGGGECTLHSIVIALMHREAFK